MLAHAGGHAGVFFVQQIHLLQIQRGVFLRQGDDDGAQLVGQRAGAVQNGLFAGVDVRKGIVHHIEQQRLLGGVDRVDGLFADVDGACRFLHCEAQSLAPEELHPDRPQSFTQGGL